MNDEPALRPGVRVRKRGTKQTGSVYQLVSEDRAFVKWDDGEFVREPIEDLVVASAVDELAAIELAGKTRRCDPQVLRALRAELHHVRGGHRVEVQADAEKLSTVTARCLLQALQDYRNRLNRARREPWRKIL